MGFLYNKIIYDKSEYEKIIPLLQESLFTFEEKYLFPNKKILLKRLMYRNDLNLYDEKFYKYENEVLFKLSMVYDKIIIVNNNIDFSTVIPTINKELIKRKIYLKKRN